jgi:asparagine synthase (glutamine-hydrolysing)
LPFILKHKPKVINSVIDDKLTYVSKEGLLDLYESVIEIEKKGLNGVIIEAGCALGGSAIVIASAKNKARPFFVYDVFGMIPPPSEKDGEDVQTRYNQIKSGKSKGIGGNKYYGYEENLYAKVISNFEKHHIPIDESNIHLVKGLFEDTLHVNTPVALAHIDSDWYESVTTCLSRIVPHLIQGGRLIIDDYTAWLGCRRAVDEYFTQKKSEFEFINKARLHIVKK